MTELARSTGAVRHDGGGEDGRGPHRRGSECRRRSGAEEDGERRQLGGAPTFAMVAQKLGTASGGRQAPHDGRSGGSTPRTDDGGARGQLWHPSQLQKHGKKVCRTGATRRGREGASIWLTGKIEERGSACRRPW
jgi:hypothetical protein